ncbi:MAG: DUF1003 domain-containing protein [Streptosporangiales bacterium]|nr:DUF1003 domain-containing protein [Streptosporangiales bacterium]
MSLYQHVRHPHIAGRHHHGPVRAEDIRHHGSAVSRFNTRIALLVTKAVGSMWCAYAFALFDMISLPAAIHGGLSDVVTWLAQTFMQLVLLSVIMVGQNVQSEAADRRAEATYHDASATLHEVEHIQGHLAAQDTLLRQMAERLGIDEVPVAEAPGETAGPISGSSVPVPGTGEVADPGR